MSTLDPVLFCFRCAGPMLPAGLEITCAAEEMGLSRNLENTLLERFGSRVRTSAPTPPVGSRWYCPACRIAMGAEMQCAACGGTLRDLLHALVEIHPHRGFTPGMDL